MGRFAVYALVVLSLAAPAVARPEAVLGSRFADAYAAFAPLGELYRSFGDHLFVGTPISVPAGLRSGCRPYLLDLEFLHEELVVYAASDATEALGAVVRLRIDAEAFCLDFAADLAPLGALSDEGSLSEEDEARLVAAAFFARIRGLDLGFQVALDAALRGGGAETRWAMAMSFSLRSLLLAAGPLRLPDTGELAVLYYGTEEGTTPRFAVPAAVESAMAALVSVAGRELTSEEAADARRCAEQVYEYFLTN